MRIEGIELKINEGTEEKDEKGVFVRLRSGTEYTITLHNERNDDTLCKLYIDGKYIGGIHLSPTSTFTLERFLNEPKKLLFLSEFEASNISNAFQPGNSENGVIKVELYPPVGNKIVFNGSETYVDLDFNTHTLSDLKEELNLGKDADLRLNSLQNEPLQGDATLATYGIQNNSILYSEYLFSVKVYTLTGKAIPLQFKSYQTVLDLKHQFQDLEGIPADQAIFLHSRQRMWDEKLLSHYELQDGSWIYLTLRSRGGALTPGVTLPGGFSEQEFSYSRMKFKQSMSYSFSLRLLALPGVSYNLQSPNSLPTSAKYTLPI